MLWKSSALNALLSFVKLLYSAEFMTSCALGKLYLPAKENRVSTEVPITSLLQLFSAESRFLNLYNAKR